MAHQLSLTDGTTTISLADGSSCFVERYAPRAPELESTEAPGPAVYGGALSQVRYRNVTESAALFLRAASVAALQTLVRSIEAMLERAHRRQRTGSGARVFLQVQLDGEGSAWRSEVLAGRLVLDEDGLDWWPNKAVRGVLSLTRRPYFEGAETELQLSTSNLAAATGGRTIYNHDDSGTGHDNWVEIAAAQVGGALPAPVRLQVTNTSGAARSYSTFYVATLAHVDMAQLAAGMVLEAETLNSTVTADANSSAGNYAARSYTASGDVTHTGSFMFDVSAAQVQQMAGRFCRVLARFQGLAPAPIWVQMYLQDSNNSELWRGPEVLLLAATGDLRVKDLGAAPLPPADLGSGAATVRLIVQYRAVLTNGQTLTCNLDFVQLTPVEYLRVVRVGGSPYVQVANNAAVVVDEMEDVAYFLTSGSRLAGLVRDGAPVMVVPGQTQRILLLCDEGGNAMNIGRAFSVRAWYRPRRLSV
jgi:hypothetical protein